MNGYIAPIKELRGNEKYYKFDIIDSKTYSLLVLGFCTVTLS